MKIELTKKRKKLKISDGLILADFVQIKTNGAKLDMENTVFIGTANMDKNLWTRLRLLKSVTSWIFRSH